MVFESLVVDVLNRFIGEYVENLDTSQLNIGIWGGDVVLRDLKLKETCLDGLDLPVRTIYGHLGKLVLKIPWTNLYNGAVEATIESLFLLVVPTQDVTYVAEKEEKNIQTMKQNEILRIENSKLLDQQTNKLEHDKIKDSFVEKLATQIIRNVQVNIKSIHIRYEDKVTFPNNPFSFGCTLHDLISYSTDSNWNSLIEKGQDPLGMIYKIILMEGYALYWNSNGHLFTDQPRESFKNSFNDGIPKKDILPDGYEYLLGPINAKAKMQINPKPELDGSDFTIPKYSIGIDMDNLNLRISKTQYQDLIMAAESLDRLTKAIPCRKYRPLLKEYKGHYKEWWMFAYTCVVEKDIRRIKRNWDWNNISTHRKAIKEYAVYYKQKLESKKTSVTTLKALEEFECKLDVMNIIVTRQRVENEVEREGKILEEMKKVESRRGWFSYWRATDSDKEEKEKDIIRQFEEAMNTTEKEKLYKAIGYQESSAATNYPETFVDTKFLFCLHTLEISVYDEEFTSVQKALSINFKGFVLDVQRRVAANAIKIEASGETLSVFGLPQSNKIPKIISSKAFDQYKSAKDLISFKDGDSFDRQMYLFSFLFETNPINKSCDSRVQLSFKPLKIIYDAQTIIKIINIFAIQQSSVKTQLQEAAGFKFAELKKKSALGMQHIIEQHKRLELKIDMMSSYIIIPHGGFYKKDQSVLVFNLGSLKIKSKPQNLEDLSIKSMHNKGATQTEVFQETVSRSYDRFYIELENAQILIANKGENWKKGLNESYQNELYILKPTNLLIEVEKCLITDDPRLPLLKVTGELPNIDIKVAENRVLDAISVFLSVPLPQRKKEPKDYSDDFDLLGSAMSLRQKIDSFNMSKNLTNQRKDSEKASDINVQFMSLDVKLILKRLSITVLSCDYKGSWLSPLLDFNLLTLELSLTQQTFNTNISLKLGRLYLAQYHKDTIIPLVDTPDEDEKQYLLLIMYTLVDKNTPEFHTTYGSVMQKLELNFTKLLATANREALLNLIDWSTNVSNNIKNMQKQYDYLIEPKIAKQLSKKDKLKKMPLVSTALSTILEESASSKVQQMSKRTVENNSIKDMMLVAQIGEIQLIIVTETEDLAHMFVTKLESSVIMNKSHIQVDAKLQNISVTDSSPNTVYKHIIHVAEDDDALKFQMIMYKEQYLVDYDSPEIYMSITSGCIKCVFLNDFVTKVLDFINHFKSSKMAIYEASAAAVATAKMNLKSVTRIALNINLKAPVLIVPQNSNTLEALCLDLGYLSIKNSFIMVHIGSDHIPAIIDQLNLNLKDLKISRVKLNEGIKFFVFDCLLLQPITFSLIVKRNLSSAWYTEHPDFDIVVKFDSIKVTVSHEDYIDVLKVLNENLNKGKNDQAISAIEPNLNISLKNPNEAKVLEDIEQKATVQEVRTLAKFHFTVKNIILTLFKEGPDKNGSQIKDNSLGQFMFSSLTVSGFMQTDLSFSLSLYLLDVILDDTRMTKASGTKVVRYMERKKHYLDDETLQNTVDMEYKQTLTGSDVQIKIYSFNLILNMEYMTYLLNFFVIPPQGEDKTINNLVKTTKSNILNEKPVVTELKENNKTIMLNVQFEKPDIILVESLNDINTNAIILNTEATLKLLMSTPTHQTVNGTIKDLQIYSCCYNPTKRKETMNLILRPVTINIIGSTPDDTCFNIDVSMTPLIISVTPANIEMLNRINQSFTEKKENELVEPKYDEQEFVNLWNKTPFNENEFWFLKTEVGVEACSLERDRNSSLIKKSEVCFVSIPSIVFTIEAGIGTKTMPMLLTECTFNGSINNWSSQLTVAAELELQMNYYNSRLALWEPFIEPVEVSSNVGAKYKPWLLMLKLETSDANQVPKDEEEVFQRKPAMKVSLISYENFEITMTKTALEVLTSLGNDLYKAITTEQPLTKRNEAAPYIIQNNLGFDICVMISNTLFKLYNTYDGEATKDTILKDSEDLYLCLKEDESVSVNLHQTKATERSLKIKIHENNNTTEFNLPLIKADKRYFNMKHKLSTLQEPWGLVTDTQVINGSMVITLRSVVQIFNHFNEHIFLYYKKQGKLKLIGKAKPGRAFNLPVHAIYTQTKELYFCSENYQICVKPFIWKDIQPVMSLRTLLQCPPNQVEDKDPFFIQVLGSIEHIYFEHTDRYLMSSNCYNIQLYPTVILVNTLPVNLDCLMQGDFEIKTLAPGEKINLPIVEIGYSFLTLKVKYLNKYWDCKCFIEEHPDEFSIWSFTNNEDKPESNTNIINFGIRTEFQEGGTHIKTLYCPFWMINKTEQSLTYKAADDEVNMLRHTTDPSEPLMWSFNKKIFFANKRGYVKIDSGLWSDRFSLDVAGSSGSIMCKTNDTLYQIGVHIQLTNNSLSKQVIFTPFYIVYNRCLFSVDIQEADKVAKTWIRIGPNSCMPFWPQNITDNHKLNDKVFVVRVTGTLDTSTPLPYSKPRSDLIRLRNKHSAIQVDTQITESGAYITFNPYMEGMAPALIINHTENYLKFIEHDLSEFLDEIKILPPKHNMFFTWSTPTEHPILYWNMMQQQADLRKDAVGVFNHDDGIKMYWVSFLDGLQRILLFTINAGIAEECQASRKLEFINREVLVSIHSLGLSLVNNDISTEIMYLRIGSSGVIWEVKKLNASRYKPMTQKECDLIEHAYIRYTRKLAIGENEPIVTIKELNIEVNFEENIIIKPSTRNIRRIYNTGFWLNLQSSDYTSQIHAKINNLQIDSQIDNCIFPVIFAPVPPPKTIALTERKPFMELSIVERLNKNSSVKQYKYYKMLIQEFHIKLDIGFINALIKMTEKYEISEDKRKIVFNEDLFYASKPLEAQIIKASLQEQKNYYDMLHFSPLKIHVTFSLSGNELENIPPIINIVLQSIGVTITSVQDVVLKLAFFERQYVLLNQRQLIIEAQHHYVGQLIKQLYVLVLGLDVLGNPFGLVTGIKQGVEDLFYEPFQGAIQGPGEFAEGLVLGVKSLFGHTVGGAAGAVGRITGTMGKGVAALTFDKNYQKKRQELMNEEPKNFSAGLAQGGRGFVLGVVEGVEGVFKKPFSGAHNDGVKGFFKGACQGMVGLVANPLSGALDFTSGTLNTIKRVTDTTSEVQRVRLPRHFKEDKQVRPYCKLEAEGYKLLKEK
ncbi:intermembrane lipid transfer protein Vps13-like isoform X3 [Adelges cooleyi]|uniref:intermembrane lipid transfer protein Vps13-like isoform X3 n=1 Tax=Adelges cooleyi TaxID=133065 RepID=UPI00217FD4C8|nr:intermembrane lipid transfer protein Vps13-like isoform X3 [Adelges cooleyi]